VILQDDAYLSCASEWMLPPASETVVLVAVNDTMTRDALGLLCTHAETTWGNTRRAPSHDNRGDDSITILDRILGTKHTTLLFDLFRRGRRAAPWAVALPNGASPLRTVKNSTP